LALLSVNENSAKGSRFLGIGTAERCGSLAGGKREARNPPVKAIPRILAR
jgi:hypothetical protein